MSDQRHDLRLIEDYLPIVAISAEASREKSVRKGHISTLHLWWARRPLVACRAAVYGALVPADRWFSGELPTHNVHNAMDPKKREAWINGTKRGINRNAARDFVTKLCRYPKSDPQDPIDLKLKRETEAAIAEAQKHLLEAHAQRLTAELAEAATTGNWPAWTDEFKWPRDRKPVTHDDIVAGRAPRPRVLDMFAGGGAIPLEALRLGCEAYALDLNPVAHIIQLCTLVYPQKYGQPDPNTPGMTGPPGSEGKPTWGGLAQEVRHWGNWVLERVRKQIGDLYPPIPDPALKGKHPEIAFDRDTGRWIVTKPSKLTDTDRTDKSKGASGRQHVIMTAKTDDDDEDDESDGLATSAAMSLPPGYLQPVAYLWTRTVRCKNPSCAATVPLVRQTWLCKKAKRYVALQMYAPKKAKRVNFEVVESDTEKGLGFDPAGFSKAGNATCPFCGTVADNDYVKAEGRAGRMSNQPMAVVCTRPGKQGKVYVAADDLPPQLLPDDAAIRGRIAALCDRTGLTVPDEPIVTDAKNANFCIMYGLDQFGKLFTPRQMLSLLSFTAAVRDAHPLLTGSPEQAKAVSTMLACVVDKVADIGCNLARWEAVAQCTRNLFGRQAIPMLWDFGEAVAFAGSAGDWDEHLNRVLDSVGLTIGTIDRANATRGSATAQPYPDDSLDAVITDPPYYDNVPYADISDFFYVWLKRSVGHLYPEHFATAGTPKKQEAVADATRHGGDKAKAVRAYEDMMAQSLAEAHRVLKPGGTLAVVYAHKTTLGWSTLVDAFRRAGFTVTEAWPLDTENKSRLRAMDSAALASSIFLVGRKRIMDQPGAPATGAYETDVQPELQRIVAERVATLWEMGIAGADLVIACVGAGLRAFTKYEKVEYANGEEVPAEKFLAEVEAVVLDAMLDKLSGTTGSNVSAVDTASRFYVLWRFVYRTAELEAGEAIIFANGTHVDLEGREGLADGRGSLIEKKKAKYRLRDYSERGEQEGLGLPDESGRPGALIDALHRVLWLMEHSPRKLGDYLSEARPDRERLRVLAQALAGAGLSGKSQEEEAKLVSTTAAEQAALGKLLANWRSLVESRMAAEDNTLFGKAR